MSKSIITQLLGKRFNSINYWEDRYNSGENSGSGSYGKYAEFKAEILNDFVKKIKLST